MQESCLLITNNPLLENNESFYGNQLVIIKGGLEEVLYALRDYVHKGHRLLTHPMSGSVKPNENPYKSALISKNKMNKIDEDSLRIIENAIISAKKFAQKYKSMTEQMKSDFATIDLSLIKSIL